VPGQTMFLALRIVQGIAAGLVLAGGLGVIRDMFPGRRGLLALGAWAAAVVVPMTDGGVVGGLIVQYLSWRIVFAVLLVPLAAAGVLGLVGVRESRSRGPVSGLIGVALLSLVVPLLSYGLRHEYAGWLHLKTVLPLAAAVGLGVAGVVLALTVRPSPLPLRASGGAAVFALGLCPAFVAMTYVTFRLQTGWGFTAIGTGARLLPLAMTALVCAVTGGVLAGRFGPRPVLAAGCAATGVAALAAYPVVGHGGYPLLLPVIALLGAGLGATVAGAATALVGEPPDGLAGLGGGLLLAGMALGGPLSLPFFRPSSPRPLVVAGLLGIAAAGAALLLRSRAAEGTSPPPVYAGAPMTPPMPAPRR
jgi:DHA2 family methylenomycin A resistance protein-like MFS transporter